jgi:AcrR family transcriptional regulator
MELSNLRARFPEEPTDPRQRAIRAAADLFTRYGYAATSTDQIAKAADLKPAALYRHFSSKEDLLATFLEAVYEGFLADMEVAVAEADGPAERLARIAWAHTIVQLTLGTLPRAHIETMFSATQLLASLSPERAGRLRALAKAHLEHCRAIIADGCRGGVFNVPDPRSAALAITTMCEYAPLWFRHTGPLSAEEVADRHALYALRIVAADIPDLATFAARATGTAGLEEEETGCTASSARRSSPPPSRR